MIVKPQSPRLVMTLLVRDEMDIIRENVEFHLHHGVDSLVITDNGSTDGTRDYLAELERDGIAAVIDEPEQDYAQAVWVTRMAHLARDCYGADWILHNDADEFWLPASGNLKDELIGQQGNVLSCPRWNMLPDRPILARADYRFLNNNLKVARPFTEDAVSGCNQRSLMLFQANPKVMTRAAGLNEVAQGNHACSMDSAVIVPSRNVQILHFPLRTYEQFERKVVNGGASYARNKNLPENIGWHWRRWYRLWQEGQLPAEFEQLLPGDDQLIALIQEGRVVVDERIQRWFLEFEARPNNMPDREITHAQPAHMSDDTHHEPLLGEISKLYDRDFYDMHTPWKKEYETIAESLVLLLDFESVIDLGCGNAYVIESLDKHAKKVVGIEGSESSLSFVSESIRDKVHIKDLRRPLDVGRFDLVMCLEVAEHLDEKYADTLVDTICRHSKRYVFFTGATPEQTGGRDHVNLQPHHYWIKKFHERGFMLRKSQSDQMRSSLNGKINQIKWIPKNTMIFENTTAPQSQSNPSDSRRICLASCFLSPSPETIQLWNDFNSVLESVGWRLVLVTNSTSGEYAFQQIEVPFWLDGFVIPGDVPEVVVDDGPEIDALLHRDRYWGNRMHVSRAESLRGYAACQRFYDLAVEELQPSFCLPWGATLPQSYLFKQVAEGRGIPFKVCERGLFTGTLMIEKKGNNALSDLTVSPLCESIMQDSDPDYYSAIREYYLANRPLKYKAPEFMAPDELGRSLGVKGKTIVAFFGQNDAAVGLIPRELPSSHLQSPVFATSLDALAALVDVLRDRKDIVLIFKPHPHDLTNYDAYESKSVKVVREANIHSIMNAASVVACGSSTVQFEALLYEKPLLLLANGELAGKGIAYECQSYQDLKTAVDGALARLGLAERVARSRRFVVGVNKQFLYACHDEVPSSGKLKDLVSFVVAAGVDRDGETASLADSARVVPWYEFLTRKQKREAAKVESLYLRSQQLVQKGDLEEAMETLQAIISLHPDHAVVHNDLGAIYVRKGDHRKALTHFKRAVAANGRYLLARKNLADLQMLLGNFDEAACLYQLILNQEPDDIDALSGLGRLGIEAGKLDSARYFFQRLVEVDPHQMEARQCLEALQRLAPPTASHTIGSSPVIPGTVIREGAHNV